MQLRLLQHYLLWFSVHHLRAKIVLGRPSAEAKEFRSDGVSRSCATLSRTAREPSAVRVSCLVVRFGKYDWERSARDRSHIVQAAQRRVVLTRSRLGRSAVRWRESVPWASLRGASGKGFGEQPKARDGGWGASSG
eukprot:351985-Rhodomonas_salina.1